LIFTPTRENEIVEEEDEEGGLRKGGVEA